MFWVCWRRQASTKRFNRQSSVSPVPSRERQVSYNVCDYLTRNHQSEEDLTDLHIPSKSPRRSTHRGGRRVVHLRPLLCLGLGFPEEEKATRHGEEVLVLLGVVSSVQALQRHFSEARVGIYVTLANARTHARHKRYTVTMSYVRKTTTN